MFSSDGAAGEREERLAGPSVQHVDVAEFRDLRDRIDAAAVPGDGDQIRRGGKVPVPDVVFDALEMPQALAGARVERQDAVGEQVVAVAVDAIEVE